MINLITVFFLFVILKLFFRLKIEGKENIPKVGAFILASNHISYFDPPILAASCLFGRGRCLNFIAKEELFKRKFFGWYITKLNAFPIKRKFGDIGAIRESIRRIKKGMPIVIFPEGERSPDGSVKEAFPGIALLATKTKIPIVPAFISGVEETLSVKSKSVKFNQVCVRFGKPIYFYDSEKHSYSEIVDKIMSSVKELAVV
jgi:1-acyl-sn-glycerol-3-phosphate acyltransferase